MRKIVPLLLIIGLVYGIQEYQSCIASGGVNGSNYSGFTATQQSRHQRFIVELSSGRTVLIAHNIDLAPRVRSLKVGDTVSFYGEYKQMIVAV